MARLRQKPPCIAFDKSKERWRVSWYEDGSRRRAFFPFKYQAEALAKQIEKERDRPVSSTRQEVLDIKSAIKRYVLNQSSKKAYGDHEKRNFTRLVDYLCLEKRRKMLDEVTPLDLEDYQSFRETQVSASTVNREFCSYNTFFKWCVKRKLLLESPGPIPNLTADGQTRQVWPEDLQEMIFAKLNPVTRNPLQFMAFTGARNNEAIGLTWGDVDFEKGLVRLSTRKGSGALRVDYVPLPAVALSWLDGLYQEARKSFRAKATDIVFPNDRGMRLSRTSLSQAVYRVRKELGIKVELVPYGLRHTTGTELAMLNLESARKVLRHASLKTTQKYLHIEDEFTRELMERRAQKISGHLPGTA